MRNFQFVIIGYLLIIIGLFLYSYTQVDLNLTLSQWSVWQVIQKSFQHIGWFQRPLSTFFYLLLLILVFIFYFLLLRMAKSKRLTIKQFWQLLLPTSLILLFSYNAFSYDLFNYMFDARIVTHHNLNPYGYKALDFPGDPWINFMRWTHRTYPYGDVWLWLTVPLSFLGSQFFLPTLFLFKALMVGAFLGSVYFIGKILDKIHAQEKLFGMVVFAFNPLVLIESLVSAHNDIVMMFFVLTGFYGIITKRYLLGLVGFLLSAYIKFISKSLPDSLHQIIPIAIIFLVLGFWIFTRIGKKINWSFIFWAGLVLMIAAILFASQRTELQPWYFLWVLPFVALLAKRRELIIAASVVSIGLLLHYVPFLYTGNWNVVYNIPIPTIKYWLTAGSVFLGLGIVFANKWFYK